MVNSKSWEAIFEQYKINAHDFDYSPFTLSAADIKKACQKFEKTSEKEPHILCKQDCRESRPDIFKKNELFILPIKNGKYSIIKGEGYVDLPNIKSNIENYNSELDFTLDTLKIRNSTIQDLDYAYACGLIHSFTGDSSLFLTKRGRKYTPPFSFKVGAHTIETESVQIEVDAGYEGGTQNVLVEAQNNNEDNIIIRQLYYPYCQWKEHTQKDIAIVLFNKVDDVYYLRQFKFSDPDDYNSIVQIKARRFYILCPNINHPPDQFPQVSAF